MIVVSVICPGKAKNYSLGKLAKWSNYKANDNYNMAINRKILIHDDRRVRDLPRKKQKITVSENWQNGATMYKANDNYNMAIHKKILIYDDRRVRDL